MSDTEKEPAAKNIWQPLSSFVKAVLVRLSARAHGLNVEVSFRAGRHGSKPNGTVSTGESGKAHNVEITGTEDYAATRAEIVRVAALFTKRVLFGEKGKPSDGLKARAEAAVTACEAEERFKDFPEQLVLHIKAAKKQTTTRKRSAAIMLRLDGENAPAKSFSVTNNVETIGQWVGFADTTKCKLFAGPSDAETEITGFITPQIEELVLATAPSDSVEMPISEPAESPEEPEVPESVAA